MHSTGVALEQHSKGTARMHQLRYVVIYLDDPTPPLACDAPFTAIGSLSVIQSAGCRLQGLTWLQS